MKKNRIHIRQPSTDGQEFNSRSSAESRTRATEKTVILQSFFMELLIL